MSSNLTFVERCVEANHIELDSSDFFKRRTVLFGASKRAVELALPYFIIDNIRIDYLCDNDPNKWETEVYGIKVLSPKELIALGRDINIFIASRIPESINAIKDQLRREGFKHVYDTYFPFHIFTTDKRELLKHSKKIDELIQMVKDDKSKITVENLIKYRLTYDSTYLKEVVVANEYLPEDIINFKEEEYVIDAGAYTGDTIKTLIEHAGNKVKKVWAFEPDVTNYSRLMQLIDDQKWENIVVPFNLGIYNESTHLHFNGGNRFLSKISNKTISTGETVKVVALDDFLNDKPVTYIKMDNEGAELAALMGASNLITRYQPKLAICIYHAYEHLWEIPKFIKSLNPNYQIFIRQHKTKATSTVCYAIPT